MDAVTTILMLKSLDGLSARAEATAENIANAGTPGYRPLQVSFESALAAAARQGAGAVAGVTPHMERGFAPELGPDLRLDLELATQSSTAARYAALITILDRRMQLDAIAVSGVR